MNVLDPSITIGIIQILLSAVPKVRNLKKRNPVQIALRRLEANYPNIEGIREYFESMLLDKDFQIEMKKILEGNDKSINLKKLTDILVKKYQFYFADQTFNKSKKLISSFLLFLKEEYLRTSDGMLILAKNLERFEKSADSKLNQIIKEKKINETPINKFIDEIKELIHFGKVKTAKKILLSLLNEVEEIQGISNKILYRIYTNLGACELHLDNQKKAAEYFIKAYKFNQKDEKSLLNMATANLLIDEADKGFSYVNQILEKDILNPEAIIRKASLYLDKNDFKSAISLFFENNEIEKHFKDDMECLNMIGEIFFKMEDYKNSQKYFKKAYNSGSFDLVIMNCNLLIMLSLSILEILVKEIPYFPNYLNHIEINKLKKAENLLTEAIDLLKNTELETRLIRALEYRSSVRLFLNELKKCSSDCELLLEIEKDNIVAIENKGYVESANRNYPEAIEFFSKLIRYKGKIEKRKFKQIISNIIKAYINIIPIDDSKINELFDKYSSKIIDEDELILELTKIEYLIYKNNFIEVKKRLDSLKEKFPDNIEVNKTLLVFFIKHKKDLDIEKEYLDLPASLRNRREIVLVVAEFFKNNGIFDKAILYYEKIIDSEVIDYNLKDYLYCLTRSEEKNISYKKIVKICKYLRNKYGVLENFSELEADIDAELGNLANASDLYKKLIKKFPKNKSIELKNILVELRTGKNVSETLQNLKENISYFKDSPLELMTIAEVLYYVGEIEESIKIGYNATIKKIDDVKLNLAYISLILSRDNKSFSKPEKVQVDTFITFIISGEKRSIKIIDREEEEISDTTTIDKESKLAKILLGKSVGDKLEYDNNNIEIIEIKSKYIKLYQDIVDSLDLKIEEKDGFKKIKFDKDFKEKFIGIINERYQRVSEIIDYYKNYKCTIGLVSSLIGQDIFSTWEALTLVNNLQLLCSRGNLEKENKEFNYIIDSESILIDIIGLFTLNMLNLFQHIQKIFKNIYVSQFTLDEIIEIIGELNRHLNTDEYSVFSKHEDGYIFSNITKDILISKINILENIKDFITNNTKVIGLKEYSKMSSEKYLKSFGRSSINTIITAKENNLVFYSDDVVLREVAFDGNGILSVDIQSILKKLLEKRVISNEEKLDFLLELIKRNYYFININLDLFKHILLKCNYDPGDPDFIKALSRLETKENLLPPVVKILGDLIKIIWRERIQDIRKSNFLYKILKALVNRGGYIALNLFRRYLKKIFLLDPITLNKLDFDIEVWIKTNKTIYTL